MISCSKAKRRYSCEARLLYDASNLFRKSLAYAKTLSDDIFVLSAKYGLVDLDTVIEPYDETLNEKSVGALSEWGQKVAGQIKQRLDINNTTFIILAGRNYYAPLYNYIPKENIELPLGNLSFGERLKRLDELLSEKTQGYDNICTKLHKLFNSMPHFHWDTIDQIGFNNGIYIIFEKGETYKGFNRIVRVGTHRSDNRLRARLKNHFIDKNKDGSIFRKNIGRTILSKSRSNYIDVWNIDSREKDLVANLGKKYNQEFQIRIENEVSEFMYNNLWFTCFPVESGVERLRLEEGIIAALNSNDEFKASSNWFGNYSPEREIVNSGMWLKQGLDGKPLSESEYMKIVAYCSGNKQVIQKANEPVVNIEISTAGKSVSEILWQRVVSALNQSPQDIYTVNKYGNIGKWIHASAVNDTVQIGAAKQNIPSSKLTSTRFVCKNEFIELYPLYYQWKKGKITREQAKGRSMNSSYIFALKNKFDNGGE